MKIISNKKKLLKFIKGEKNLGLVPTMGALHLGHISLIRKCIAQCNKTVVTIFVNKPQFNKQSDFQKYPRVLKKDILILKKLRVDFVYLPSTKQIYPNGPNKKIKINRLGKKLCGKFRPGHFEAVIDVVDRFIKIIAPRRIYFGQKDFQQLKIIEDFVRKKHYKTKVIPCRTVREKNGMAYSSRNILLSLNEKNIGSNVYKILINQKRLLIKKKSNLHNLKKKIYNLGVKKIEYLSLMDINKFIKPFKKKTKYRIFVSYYLGSVRLIDNV